MKSGTSPRKPAGPLADRVPDLTPHAAGNTGIPYAWTFTAAVPGPHVVVCALMHGNEIAGPIALVRLLSAGVRPQRGRLSLVFLNIDAFARFDAHDPRASRYVEEDMNRLWSAERLDAAGGAERRRATALLPLLRDADQLLDLHSMQTHSPPLMLATCRAKGLALARALGMPEAVVCDAGHANGTRLIDAGPFGDPDDPRTAILLEAGQHWRARTAEVAFDVTVRFLEVTGAIDAATAHALAPNARPGPQRVVEVTHAITVESDVFRFERELFGLEIVPKAGTVIAHDGPRPITTPYPNCVLVMPSRRLRPGLTAVRLGRLIP